MPKKILTTKKVVEKKTPKKAAKKAETKVGKPLVLASNQKSFWVNDGQILNSLIALHDALDLMEKHHFDHHVTKEKNDFADWVDSVLGDSACAADLTKAKTPKAARMVVAKHLKFYIV